jgi:hypothetical protein
MYGTLQSLVQPIGLSTASEETLRLLSFMPRKTGSPTSSNKSSAIHPPVSRLNQALENQKMSFMIYFNLDEGVF